MKKYQSHKIVEAGMVLEVYIFKDGGMVPSWAGSGLGSPYYPIYWGVSDPDAPNGIAKLRASHELVRRGGENPVGGYYVRYEDGFESWSPAEAFEKGYTEVKVCPVCGRSPIIPTIYPAYTCTNCANEGRVSE